MEEVLFEIEELTKKILNLISFQKGKNAQSEINKSKIVLFKGGGTKEEAKVSFTKEDNKKMAPEYKDGSIRIRNSGIYEYRFMHEGKQISVYGKSEKDCYDKRTAVIKGTKKIKSTPTLSEWLNEWFRLYKASKNGERSLKSIKGYIERISAAIGSYKITELSGIVLQNYINLFSDRLNTQRKISLIINGALKKAFNLRLIKQNPFSEVEIETYQKESYRALEFAEQQLIYDNCEEKYKKLFFFCCCTGIRIGKVLELTRDNIDFENKIIIVEKKQKKNFKNKYYVPFTDELFEIVPLTDNKIFNLSYEGAKTYFSRLFKKLNIENASIHSFRHTFISTCYFAGFDLKFIQKIAGHNNFNMTTDIYTHLLRNGNSVILEYIKKMKNPCNFLP